MISSYGAVIAEA